MKFNFYFIHGWGLDSDFWDPVKKKIELDNVSKSSTCLDLNFFSKNKKIDCHLKSKNNIFIVHSYGLQWFLRNHLNCKLLINFFGVPDFIRCQKKPDLVNKKIIKMNKLLNEDPNRVLNNFYKICNLKFKKRKIINVDLLSSALNELKSSNYIENLKRLDFNIHSIFSLKDKVLNLNHENLDIIKNKNHHISFLKDSDHGFPNLKPDLCYKIIKEIIKKR